LWLAWRLYRSRNKVKNNQLNQILIKYPRHGSDSDFYRIEQRLAEQGWGRRAHETTRDWMARLEHDAIDVQLDSALLARVVDLHNRHRFDPQGLDETQRAHLKALASEWLARYAAAAAPRT
jgi:hypothetical protein